MDPRIREDDDLFYYPTHRDPHSIILRNRCDIFCNDWAITIELAAIALPFYANAGQSFRLTASILIGRNYGNFGTTRLHRQK